jgi:hypothetical protein
MILFDEPRLGNRNGERMQLGEDAMASPVRDSEARRDESAAAVGCGDPGAHPDTVAATAEQREEPERGWSLVIVVDLGYQVHPAVFVAGKPRHTVHYLGQIVDAELHSLDFSKFASHA